MRDGFANGCLHHHALCSQRVSCTLCQTARRFKGLARRFLEVLRLWLRAGARFPRLSTARLRRLETVSRRRKQRPVRERRRPVRKRSTPDEPAPVGQGETADRAIQSSRSAKTAPVAGVTLTFVPGACRSSRKDSTVISTPSILTMWMLVFP